MCRLNWRYSLILTLVGSLISASAAQACVAEHFPAQKCAIACLGATNPLAYAVCMLGNKHNK